MSNSTLKSMNASLEEIKAQGKKVPPLEKWHPELSGDMDLVIKANGEWWHEGTKMTRQKLVDLFSSILWCEVNPHTDKQDYFLKSPVEKWRIQVTDVPLMVTGVEQIQEHGQSWLQFTTQNGDIVIANKEHPLVMQQYTAENGQLEQRPYIYIRTSGEPLHAFIHRNTFYHLVEMGTLVEKNDSTFLQLNSGHETFMLEAS